ncbi:hypothetical protein BDV98DRAFT_307009 [Pterulicium gracile]|uniref:Uncharacterized protein n=1 Tax=Pterulicium gracile TaxID=1884261 RepID=A0A5C3Q8G1_9AGAR|nr:hypothetical protein BDV98DRAFT_307009 [Pterula gracilis]
MASTAGPVITSHFSFKNSFLYNPDVWQSSEHVAAVKALEIDDSQLTPVVEHLHRCETGGWSKACDPHTQTIHTLSKPREVLKATDWRRILDILRPFRLLDIWIFLLRRAKSPLSPVSTQETVVASDGMHDHTVQPAVLDQLGMIVESLGVDRVPATTNKEGGAAKNNDASRKRVQEMHVSTQDLQELSVYISALKLLRSRYVLTG